MNYLNDLDTANNFLINVYHARNFGKLCSN